MECTFLTMLAIIFNYGMPTHILAKGTLWLESRVGDALSKYIDNKSQSNMDKILRFWSNKIEKELKKYTKL